MPSFGLQSVSAGIVIACTTASIWSLLIFLIRLFLRLRISGPFGWDDATCAAATVSASSLLCLSLIDSEAQVFGIAESCTALLAVHYGLGNPEHEIGYEEVKTLFKLIWVAGQLYAFAVGFSVLSITCFITRLTKNSRHLRVLYGLLIAICVWMTISELLIALQCGAPHPWDISDQSTCLNKVGVVHVRLWQAD